MTSKLQDAVILVTGSTGGIGTAIVHELAASKCKFVLTARNTDRLSNLNNALLSKYDNDILCVSADVTLLSDCQHVVNEALTKFKRIDILIYCAGYAPPAPLTETTVEIWDVTIDTCLKGLFLMSSSVLPDMLKREQGTILTISSMAGLKGFANRAAYCAAKWGVQGFTEALKAEVNSKNIRCHTINPGAVATAWWENNNSPKSDEVKEKMIQPQEVAQTVSWVLQQPERIFIDQVAIQTAVSPWGK